MNRVLFKSSSDNWKTPKEFYQALDAEFRFTHDPCPFRSVQNNLDEEWGERNFINPPYSQIEKWVKKAFQEYQKGRLCVMLIPSRTDTRWWHDYVMKASEIRFVKGRLRFSGAKHNAPFPSAIIVFKPEV